MPTKERLGLDEEALALRPGEQLTETGEDRPIGLPESRSRGLSTKDCGLVSQDDHLDGEMGIGPSLETTELQDSEEGEIEVFMTGETGTVPMRPVPFAPSAG